MFIFMLLGGFFFNFTSFEKLTSVASAISENIHNPELSKYFHFWGHKSSHEHDKDDPFQRPHKYYFFSAISAIHVMFSVSWKSHIDQSHSEWSLMENITSEPIGLDLIVLHKCLL